MLSSCEPAIPCQDCHQRVTVLAAEYSGRYVDRTDLRSSKKIRILLTWRIYNIDLLGNCMHYRRFTSDYRVCL